MCKILNNILFDKIILKKIKSYKLLLVCKIGKNKRPN